MYFIDFTIIYLFILNGVHLPCTTLVTTKAAGGNHFITEEPDWWSPLLPMKGRAVLPTFIGRVMPYL